MSLGLQHSGFQLAYAFDLDDKAVRSMKANHTNQAHLIEVADIADLLKPGALGQRGLDLVDVDLVVGGPPCQGFSVQRTIGGDLDDRNELVLKFMQFVDLLQPRFFLMENVPALAGKRGKAILNRALDYIESRGYVTESRVLDAADYGVPQRRRRRFVLGEKTDSPFMSVSLPAKPVCSPMNVREAISHYPVPPQDGSDHPSLALHRRDRLSETNLRRLSALKGGEGRKDLPVELLAECHKRDPDEIGHRNVYGRMHWDRPAPTITARFDSFTRGQFGHPEQHRTISLREGATLQSFPESYIFVGSKVEVARQIGNAVPPRLAKFLGDTIIGRLQG